MKRNTGSVLIPLLILMIICAGGTAYVTHLISVNSQQALGLRTYLASRTSTDNDLKSVSSLLKETGHDVSILPSDVVSHITEQQILPISQGSIVLTSVVIGHQDNQLTSVAAQYVRYPWIKQLPSQPIVSTSQSDPALSMHAHSLSQVASTPVAYPQNLKSWLLSAPDALNTLPQTIADCTELDASSQGAFIVDGECTISEEQVVGSPTQPVLLIVRQSHFSMQDNSQLWGILYHTASSENDLSRIDVPATAAISGAVLIDHKLAPGSTLNINYAPGVLASLRTLPSLQLHHYVAGSWRDFQ
ncbi:hypothetical protein HHX48_16285 [Salinimonas sp. HHU 13199]|uniref:SAF domain-containing protein n=1 Tax=Salinimonas profundi TaxID=2729140 RepID=A0ABR8LPQ7_9ALTE|nr:hypothetical protein [Salinimonas profundi]MBD3587295.1 hypothetical protein [Salinimonas profundi]